MTDQSKSFWASIQGILTGFAAVITAVTGLYIAISGDDSSPLAEVAKNVEATTTTPPAKTEKIAAPSNTVPIQTTSQQAHAATEPPAQKIVQQAQSKTPFPQAGPLVDCTLFPTVNTVRSLMSWSNYYHKQIIEAEGSTRRASGPCNTTIDQRGMAHCKAPYDSEVRQALLATLTLCRAAGIEWQDIEHQTIIGK